MFNVLQIAINCRVILNRNIATQHCLTNGQEGVITGFEFLDDNENPSILYVKFDNVVVGRAYQLVEHGNSVAIEEVQSIWSMGF